MQSFRVRIGRDSQDFDLHASGTVVGKGAAILFDPKMCRDEPAYAKVQGIVYALETGLRLRLLWEHAEDLPSQILVPLEGRGTLDLIRFGGFDNPRLDGHTGRIVIEAEADDEKPRIFTLALELTKQRA